MAHLAAFLLGPPRVEVDGQPLEVDTRKATALFAYLAVTGQRASRDGLATLLWPEYEPERARAALRRTLSTLNKALDGRFLEIDRTSVRLDADGVGVDVREFRRLLAEGDVAAAVELHRGSFMAGFGLRDSVEFDDWLLLEDAQLRRELASALERLVRARAESGDLPGAIAHARRLLELDELGEHAHRLLIELYARSGDRAAAIAQYRDCVRVLHRELGVSPLEETTALYEAVAEGRVPETPPEPTHEPADGRPPLPFTGRERELAALVAAQRAAAPDGRLAVIEGEAGIGKSRLAAELLAQAQTAGATVVALRASETEAGLAYGLALEALRALSQDGRLGGLPAEPLVEAARLLPELRSGRADLGEPPPLDGPGAQSRFIAGVAEALATGLAGAEAGVLAVDDAHWADGPSLELVSYLTRRLRGRPLLILLTWRDDEVGPAHALHRLAEGAVREGAATIVKLERLDRMAVRELARAAGAESAADRVYTESDGLPLFVVEYLAALEQGEDAASIVPGGVAALLRSRAGRVSDGSAQVLVAVSVLGGPFDPALVRAVSGRREEETVSALEELCTRGLLKEEESGYAFAHEKLREVVYADASLARRRLLHRRTAEALAGRNRRDPGALAALVAEHYGLAGSDEEAADFHRLAGARARSLYANAEALGHFRSALALNHPDVAGLEEAIGDLLTLRGEYAAAIGSYEAGAALAVDASQLGRLEHKLGAVHHRRGDWELAAGHFDAASRQLGGDSAVQARLEADRSLNEHRLGHSADALDRARRALALAEDAGADDGLVQAHNIVGVLASSQGDLVEAREHLERSLSLAERLDDRGARVAALNNLAIVARAGGELDEALSLTQAALDLCVLLGDRHREAALRNNLADLLRASGQDEAAMAELKRAVAIFAEIGSDAGDAQPEIWKLVEW